jgi:hypothetical protein
VRFAQDCAKAKLRALRNKSKTLTTVVLMTRGASEFSIASLSTPHRNFFGKVLLLAFVLKPLSSIHLENKAFQTT